MIYIYFELTDCFLFLIIKINSLYKATRFKINTFCYNANGKKLLKFTVVIVVM